MKKLLTTFIFFCFLTTVLNAQAPAIPVNWPGITGLWEFDNQANLTHAALGMDLVLTGSQTSIPGPSAGDLAVTIGTGSYYKCFHNISANGGGTMVNQYSLVIDFRIPSVGPWYCFQQTNATNSNDGELFISPAGKIGRATAGPGYTDYSVIPGEWYRMVVMAELGNHYKIYLDGILVRDGGALAIDGDYALYPSAGNNFFYFFADNDGEDAPIDIAKCAVFDRVLTPAETETLGGYGHEIMPVLTGILPYLQTPTPNSVYISWHSDQVTSTLVNFGETLALNNSATGTVESIGSKKWHTVKLINLSPNTEYHYQCISGNDSSDIFTFRTQPNTITENSHYRFLIFGDNQENPAVARHVAQQAKLKMEELFGDDIQNHIQLIYHLGDIVSNGSDINQYEDQYFKPFSSLSCNIPSMVTIGNHELDQNYYYQYMKFEDLNEENPSIAERYYSFKILNNRFIAINSNTAYQNSSQFQWFQNQLSQEENDPATSFVFVFGHHPGQSEIWPDGNTVWVKNQILDQMKIYHKSAIYACGHTHAYEHGTVETDGSGFDIQTIINGGAGGPLDRWGMYANQTNYPDVFKSLDHYCFNLIDIDLSNQSYTGYTYSFGNPDHPLNCELVDEFHRKLTQPGPQQPTAISPSGYVMGPITLHASNFMGSDSLFSSEFQVTNIPGDYLNPIIQIKRDKIDYYGDSGNPDYLPINLNNLINLTALPLTGNLVNGTTYGWRVRYRDANMRWSAWSEETTFTPTSGYIINGATLYDNYQQSPISQTQVSLYQGDSLIHSTTSDATGYFVFPAVVPGTYQLRCHSNHTWGGANAIDALLIMKHFVGLINLQGLKQLAADVDLSHVINSVDALFTNKRYVGLMNSFSAGDWIFEKPGVTVGANNQTVIIKGICVGDVNGSYVP